MTLSPDKTILTINFAESCPYLQNRAKEFNHTIPFDPKSGTGSTLCSTGGKQVSAMAITYTTGTSFPIIVSCPGCQFQEKFNHQRILSTKPRRLAPYF